MSSSSQLPTLRMVELKQWSIFDQLRLEEALLRAGDENWCVFNSGATAAIVLGISGKIDELVNREHWEKQPIPLIRRFSGGGTVVIGEDTLFVTLIINQKALPKIGCYPEPILRWTEGLYVPLLSKPLFGISENDYTLGDRKFGGNAQYLCRDRWLHHTSLLWDFHDTAMDYLAHPKRQPQYRAQRSHCDFLCRLKDHVATPHQIFEGIHTQLAQSFRVERCDVASAATYLEKPHRKTTQIIQY